MQNLKKTVLPLTKLSAAIRNATLAYHSYEHATLLSKKDFNIYMRCGDCASTISGLLTTQMFQLLEHHGPTLFYAPPSGPAHTIHYSPPTPFQQLLSSIRLWLAKSIEDFDDALRYRPSYAAAYFKRAQSQFAHSSLRRMEVHGISLARNLLLAPLPSSLLSLTTSPPLELPPPDPISGWIWGSNSDEHSRYLKLSLLSLDLFRSVPPATQHHQRRHRSTYERTPGGPLMHAEILLVAGRSITRGLTTNLAFTGLRRLEQEYDYLAQWKFNGKKMDGAEFWKRMMTRWEWERLEALGTGLEAAVGTHAAGEVAWEIEKLRSGRGDRWHAEFGERAPNPAPIKDEPKESYVESKARESKEEKEKQLKVS